MEKVMGKRWEVYKFIMVILLASSILWLLPAHPVSADTSVVQMSYSSSDPLGGGNASTWCRLGQRLVIPDRAITSIGYAVWRVGNPTGNVTLSIRDAETDEVIVSKLWGDANELSEVKEGGYQDVLFIKPLRINGEVRICVEYYGGNATDHCAGGYYTGNKITGECYTNYYHYGTDVDGWHDIGEAEEGSYRYTYVGEGGNSGNGVHTNWWPFIFTIVGGILSLVFLIRYFVVRKRSRGA